MSATCEKTFTITVLEGEMPLNSAVYEPSRDRIYAVRDNWIFELNANTGAKISESRFTPIGVPADSYIDYDSVSDKLWVTFWRNTSDINSNFAGNKFLAEINPADITSAVLHPFTGLLSTSGGMSFWSSGPSKLVTRNAICYLAVGAIGTTYANELARINLAVPSVTNNGSISGGVGASWTSIFFDGTLLFVGSNADEDVKVLNPANLAASGFGTGEVAGLFPYGIARNSSGTGFLYIATASTIVVKAEVGGGLSSSVIDLGRPTANPHNIRFNANDGLFYIPLYRDDSVAVLNPADDSFVIKTGFSNPFDVVFTASKKFVVQHSGAGIKEIS